MQVLYISQCVFGLHANKRGKRSQNQLHDRPMLQRSDQSLLVL